MKKIIAILAILYPNLALSEGKDPIFVQRNSGYQTGIDIPVTNPSTPGVLTPPSTENSSSQEQNKLSVAPPAKWNSQQDINSILTTVEDIKRRPDEVDANVLRRQMLNMFDVKLPRIEQTCDRAIAYPLLKLAYNFSRSLPGIDADLLDLASKLKSVGGDRPTFKGVSGLCSVELKSLSTGILSLYRGPSWSDPRQ